MEQEQKGRRVGRRLGRGRTPLADPTNTRRIVRPGRERPLASPGQSANPVIVGGSAMAKAARRDGRRGQPNNDTRVAAECRQDRQRERGLGWQISDHGHARTGGGPRHGARPHVPGGGRRAWRYRGALQGRRPPRKPRGSLASKSAPRYARSSFGLTKATVKVVPRHEDNLFVAGGGGAEAGPLGLVARRQDAFVQRRMKLARHRGRGGKARAGHNLRAWAGRRGRQRQGQEVKSGGQQPRWRRHNGQSTKHMRGQGSG